MDDNFSPRVQGNNADRFERSSRSFRTAPIGVNHHYGGGDDSRSYSQHIQTTPYVSRDTIDSTTTFLSTIMDPVPAPSLINRLLDSETLSAVPDMKHVDKLSKHLSESFELRRIKR